MEAVCRGFEVRARLSKQEDAVVIRGHSLYSCAMAGNIVGSL